MKVKVPIGDRSKAFVDEFQLDFILGYAPKVNLISSWIETCVLYLLN